MINPKNHQARIPKMAKNKVMSIKKDNPQKPLQEKKKLEKSKNQKPSSAGPKSLKENSAASLPANMLGIFIGEDGEIDLANPKNTANKIFKYKDRIVASGGKELVSAAIAWLKSASDLERSIAGRNGLKNTEGDEEYFYGDEMDEIDGPLKTAISNYYNTNKVGAMAESKKAKKQLAVRSSKQENLKEIKKLVEEVKKLTGKNVLFEARKEVPKSRPAAVKRPKSKQEKLKEIKKLAEQIQKITGKKVIFTEMRVHNPKPVEVYTFDELPDEVKQKVLENYWDINVDDDWWDFVYEDAKRIGVEIDKFDLDYRKIGGELLLPVEDIISKIFTEHGKGGDTYALALKYKNAAVQADEDAQEEINDKFKGAILNCYLRMLKDEYEYKTSTEAIKETIEANDYEFTSDGKIFSDR